MVRWFDWRKNNTAFGMGQVRWFYADPRRVFPICLNRNTAEIRFPEVKRRNYIYRPRGPWVDDGGGHKSFACPFAT
jgi:hypothetical protein